MIDSSQLGLNADLALREEQRKKARFIIASRAIGDTLAEQLADAEELMRMVGVHPQQDNEEFLLGVTTPTPLQNNRGYKDE